MHPQVVGIEPIFQDQQFSVVEEAEGELNDTHQ